MKNENTKIQNQIDSMLKKMFNSIQNGNILSDKDSKEFWNKYQNLVNKKNEI